MRSNAGGDQDFVVVAPLIYRTFGREAAAHS